MLLLMPVLVNAQDPSFATGFGGGDWEPPPGDGGGGPPGRGHHQPGPQGHYNEADDVNPYPNPISFNERMLQLCYDHSAYNQVKMKIRLPNDPTVNAMFKGYQTDSSFLHLLRLTVDAMCGYVHLDGTTANTWRTMTITLYRDGGAHALWRAISDWCAAQRVPCGEFIGAVPKELPGEPVPDFSGSPLMLTFDKDKIEAYKNRDKNQVANPGDVPGGHRMWYNANKNPSGFTKASALMHNPSSSSSAGPSSSGMSPAFNRGPYAVHPAASNNDNAAEEMVKLGIVDPSLQMRLRQLLNPDFNNRPRQGYNGPPQGGGYFYAPENQAPQTNAQAPPYGYNHERQRTLPRAQPVPLHEHPSVRPSEPFVRPSEPFMQPSYPFVDNPSQPCAGPTNGTVDLGLGTILPPAAPAAAVTWTVPSSNLPPRDPKGKQPVSRMPPPNSTPLGKGPGPSNLVTPQPTNQRSPMTGDDISTGASSLSLTTGGTSISTGGSGEVIVHPKNHGRTPRDQEPPEPTNQGPPEPRRSQRSPKPSPKKKQAADDEDEESLTQRQKNLHAQAKYTKRKATLEHKEAEQQKEGETSGKKPRKAIKSSRKVKWVSTEELYLLAYWVNNFFTGMNRGVMSMTTHMELMVEEMNNWEEHHPKTPKPLHPAHCDPFIIRSKLKALLQVFGLKASATDQDIDLRMLDQQLQDLYDPLEAWGTAGPPPDQDAEEDQEKEENLGENQEEEDQGEEDNQEEGDQEEDQDERGHQQMTDEQIALHFSDGTPPGTQPPWQPPN